MEVMIDEATLAEIMAHLDSNGVIRTELIAHPGFVRMQDGSLKFQYSKIRNLTISHLLTRHRVELKVPFGQ